jgi:hypothetical protein
MRKGLTGWVHDGGCAAAADVAAPNRRRVTTSLAQVSAIVFSHVRLAHRPPVELGLKTLNPSAQKICSKSCRLFKRSKLAKAII